MRPRHLNLWNTTCDCDAQPGLSTFIFYIKGEFLIHYRGSSCHPHANISKIYISRHNLSSHFQLPISNISPCLWYRRHCKVRKSLLFQAGNLPTFSTSVNAMTQRELCFLSSMMRSFAFFFFFLTRSIYPTSHRAFRNFSQIILLLSFPTLLVHILILLIFSGRFLPPLPQCTFQMPAVIILLE